VQGGAIPEALGAISFKTVPPFSRALVVLLGIVATILTGWVLHTGASILQPLVIALLLASMLQPVVRTLARWHIPPPVTVILIVAGLFFGVAHVGLLIEANVRWLFRKGQSTQLVEPRDPRPPAGATEPGRPLPDLLEGLQIMPRELDPLSRDQAEITQRFDWEVLVDGIHAWMIEHRLPEPFVEYVHRLLQEADVSGLASGFIGGGLDFMRALVLVVIYMLFIFAEQAVFRRKILSIFEDRQEDARAVLDTIGRGIQRYLGVKTITSLATGGLCYTALVLLHVPFALLLGLATFALNYIPTFGSIIVGVIATLVAVVDSEGAATPIGVAATYILVNLTLGSYLEPKILGRELNLSPLVVIVSVVVWAGLWGPVGTFLAVPLTAAMQIVLASNEHTHPIAVMLSSGPPRPPRFLRRREKAG